MFIMSTDIITLERCVKGVTPTSTPGSILISKSLYPRWVPSFLAFVVVLCCVVRYARSCLSPVINSLACCVVVVRCVVSVIKVLRHDACFESGEHGQAEYYSARSRENTKHILFCWIISEYSSEYNVIRPIISTIISLNNPPNHQTNQSAT